MKKFIVSETWVYRYRFVFGYAVLTLSSLFVLFYRLGTLLPGISNLEAETAASSMQIREILARPINFSYHMLEYVSIKVLGPTAMAIRLPSVIFAIASLVLFFFIIKSRFSKRAAIVSTLVLATSSWQLHYARMGYEGFLTIFLILALIFLATQLNQKYKPVWLLLLVITAALSLYTPYFIYILLAGVLISLALIRPNLKKLRIQDSVVTSLLFVLLVLPLMYTIFRDTSIIRELLAIPDVFPSAVEYFKNLYEIVAYVIFKSEPMAILHLGNLPMLEIFSVSMVALGLYHYDHELSRNLSRLILGGLLVVIILLGFNANQLQYSLLIPFIYFLLAGGLVVLFTQWNEIFPKNPIARLIAIVPITVLLIIVASYHVQRYFIAWPRTPATVNVYSYTYTALESELRDNDALTTVLAGGDEKVLMQPLSMYYDSVAFTYSTDDSFGGEDGNRLIITDAAYLGLSDKQKEDLGEPTRKVDGLTASQPVVLCIYDVSM